MTTAAFFFLLSISSSTVFFLLLSVLQWLANCCRRRYISVVLHGRLLRHWGLYRSTLPHFLFFLHNRWWWLLSFNSRKKKSSCSFYLFVSTSCSAVQRWIGMSSVRPICHTLFGLTKKEEENNWFFSVFWFISLCVCVCRKKKKKKKSSTPLLRIRPLLHITRHVVPFLLTADDRGVPLSYLCASSRTDEFFFYFYNSIDIKRDKYKYF